MRIGCPREIKNREYRVGLTPESAKELVKHGHEVWVETEAGTGIGASDQEYEAAGAKIHPDPADPVRRVRDDRDTRTLALAGSYAASYRLDPRGIRMLSVTDLESDNPLIRDGVPLAAATASWTGANLVLTTLLTRLPVPRVLTAIGYGVAVRLLDSNVPEELTNPPAI